MRYVAALILLFPLLASAACTDKAPKTFTDFLTHYIDDPRFARQHTEFPLHHVRWEYGTGAHEGKAVRRTTRINSAPASGPVVLGKFMQDNALQFKIRHQDRAAATIEVFKPDTDWLIHYQFRRRNGCWYLWQIEDASL